MVLPGDRYDQIYILKSHCGCHLENGLEERKRERGDWLGNPGPFQARRKVAAEGEGGG